MGEVEMGVTGDYRFREINAVLILCYLRVSNSNFSGIGQDSVSYSCGMFILLNRVFIPTGAVQEAVSPCERTN